MSLKTYTRFSLFALLVYLAVSSKQEVFADTNTTCSGDLDTPGERYVLTSHTLGDCVVTANGVIIDAAGFTINGDVVADAVTSGGAGFNVTIENAVVTGGVVSTAGQEALGAQASDAGNITIIDSDVTGNVLSHGGSIDSSGDDYHTFNFGGGDGGIITITNSDTGNVTSRGGSIHPGAYGSFTTGNGGNIFIEEGSEVGIVTSHVQNIGATLSGGSSGNVTISDSIAGNIILEGESGASSGYVGGNAGSLSITDSGTGSITLVGKYGTIGGNTGTISITRSSVEDISSTGGEGVFIGGGTGNITITDSFVGIIEAYGGEGGETNGTDATLTLIDNAPTITVDPEEVEIDFDDIFTATSTGVTADDAKDGGLTEDIEVSGTVGAEAGEYELEYSVTDLGTVVLWNGVSTSTASSTDTATRLVTRLAEVIPEPEEEEETPRRRSGGRSGGGSSSKTPTPAVTTPTTPSTTSPALSDLARQITLPTQRNLTVGATGQDVLLLQQFLNTKGFTIALTGPGSPGSETNFFGVLTRAALARYQAANGITPAVGYFGPVTRGSIQQN